MWRWRLFWFDALRGTPTALAALRRHLGLGDLLRVLWAVLGARVFLRPFGGLPKAASEPERFSRRQLGQLLELEHALARATPFTPQVIHDLLREVAGATGARFIHSQVPVPPRAQWRAMDRAGRQSLTEGILKRFLNAEAHPVEAPGFDVAFDVQRCHFVTLLAALDRLDLAPLFCHADAVAYDGDGPVDLVRPTTLASGGDACRFRMRYRQEGPRQNDQGPG